jgi:hypothetical protein
MAYFGKTNPKYFFNISVSHRFELAPPQRRPAWRGVAAPNAGTLVEIAFPPSRPLAG